MPNQLTPYDSDWDVNSKQFEKLYSDSIKGSDTKFALELEEFEKFKQELMVFIVKADCSELVSKMPGWEGHDDDEGPTLQLDLLKDFQKIPFDAVITAAGYLYGSTFAGKSHDFTIDDLEDPIGNVDERELLQKRLRLGVLGNFLYGSLTPNARTQLNLEKGKFTYTASNGKQYKDGLFMLAFILREMSPSTKISANSLKEELATMDPKAFGQDCKKLIAEMSIKKGELEQLGKTDEDFILHVFAAIQRGTNQEMVTFAAQLRSEWETAREDDDKFSQSAILQKLKFKWNNIAKGISQQKASQSQQKFAALTTDADIEKLVAQKVAAALKQAKLPGDTSQNRTSEIASWRKSKSFGDTVEKDGKTWFWCSQHNDGKGLYVTHRPEDHGKPRGPTSTKSGHGAASSMGGEHRMQLKDSMKSVLMSHGMTTDQAESICNDFKSTEGGQDFW